VDEHLAVEMEKLRRKYLGAKVGWVEVTFDLDWANDAMLVHGLL